MKGFILFVLFLILCARGLSQNSANYEIKTYEINDYNLYKKYNIDTAVLQISYQYNPYFNRPDTIIYIKKHDRPIIIRNAIIPYPFLVNKLGDIVMDYTLPLGLGLGLKSKQKKESISFEDVIFKSSHTFAFNAFSSLSFFNCTFNDELNLEYINCDTLALAENKTKAIRLHNIYGKIAYIVNSEISEIVDISFCTFRERVLFHNSSVANISMEQCRILNWACIDNHVNGKLSIRHSWFKYFGFRNTTFMEEVFLERLYFPSFRGDDIPLFNPSSLDRSAIYIDNTYFKEKTQFINIYYPELVYLYNISTAYKLKMSSMSNVGTHVLIYNTDFDMLEIDFSRFDLSFDFYDYDHYLDRNQIFYTYTQLIENAQKDGYVNALEKLELEYKYVKYWTYGRVLYKAWYLIEKTWWNFGYAKYMIVINSIGIWIILSFITKWHFPRLLVNVYDVEHISARHRKELKSKKPGKGLRIFFLAFIYTGIIFWNLRINIDSLKMTHFWGVFYILFIYVSGIICLSFIVNYIISL